MSKKRSKPSFKQVISVILCVVLGVALITASANIGVLNSCIEKAQSYSYVEWEDKLEPTKDENGNWVFVTDRDFRIMHLTDVHLGGGLISSAKDKMSINAVATMITREKPDLVVVSGDIAYPVPVQAGTFNNKHGAKMLTELLETLGVYWTVTFGNHDTEAYSYFDREAISEFYSDESLQYCLYGAGPESVDGYGNHVIEVKNTKGIITQALVMMDSHSYTDGDFFGLMWKYDNIHENQVQWYKNEIARMNAENAEAIKNLPAKEQKAASELYSVVKSLAFFHIPLVEMKDAWMEFTDNSFENTADFEYIDGIIGETGKRVYCGIGEDNLFEAFLKEGSTKAMFNGHDHYNNTTFKYKGIIFSYGYSVDYLAYPGIWKEGSQRGCTIITAKPDSQFTIEKFNYYSDRYDLQGFEREEVVMQFEDVKFQVEE